MISHIVIDGSNIATEGRSEPSLAQLEEAVAEVRREHPDAEVTVIVDATFSHRIDPSELERFEKAALEGEYVHPPAGAIGRGDAFLLRVAEKVDATVLSNDSFQEFHGEHPWLFERGRLLGATPVPSVGWIFSPRTPVRGPKSRRAVRDNDKAKKQVSKAIEAATKEAVAPDMATERGGDGATSRRGGARAQKGPNVAAAAVNDPLTFISFIADHPLGTEVDGQVESYTSHGAVVMMGKTQGYIPLANLADPPPRAAREVLKKGEHRRFVVTALDPQRRGVELALPGVGVVSGRPSEETIAAELRIVKRSARAKQAASKATASKGATRAPAGKRHAPATATAKAAAKSPNKPPAAEAMPASAAAMAAAIAPAQPPRLTRKRPARAPVEQASAPAGERGAKDAANKPENAPARRARKAAAEAAKAAPPPAPVGAGKAARAVKKAAATEATKANRAVSKRTGARRRPAVEVAATEGEPAAPASKSQQAPKASKAARAGRESAPEGAAPPPVEVARGRRKKSGP